MLENALKPQHLGIILLILFVIFFGRKLPEFGQRIADSFRNWRD